MMCEQGGPAPRQDSDNDSGTSGEALLKSSSGDVAEAGEATPACAPGCPPACSPAAACTIAILCFVNLINYMDRFTLAGVLSEVQDNFNIGDAYGGLLQTSFVISYMVFAPLFGYLGDRYSRKIIMTFGIVFWSLTTLVGSYMNDFGWFVVFRALVGVGEASYSTIAPTIISDLFVKNVRSKVLAIFYFAIPVGSGLGYIVGAETASYFGSWRYALRVTPWLGMAAGVLIMLFLKDPERGQAEGGSHMRTSSYREDLSSLVKNKSFMLSTLGFTCVTFVAGALAWWGPRYIYLGLKLQPGVGSTVTLNNVAYKFGLISMLSGIIGVPTGSMIAQRLRPRYPDCDPQICGLGLLISAPVVFLAIVMASKHAALCYTLIFFGEFFLNLTWSIVADILLYVVVPTRRSTAEAFQILISHTFGDAGSPYLIGVLSEVFRKINSPEGVSNSTLVNDIVDDKEHFLSLQYALYITGVVEVLGGALFLITAHYIVRDKKRVEDHVTGNPVLNSEEST